MHLLITEFDRPEVTIGSDALTACNSIDSI